MRVETHYGQSYPFLKKKDSRWSIEDLYQTGCNEIDSLINYVNELKLNIEFDRALDFGCGVGRLTQALCKYFNQCIGVDISYRMLQIASVHNLYKGKCFYILNCAPDLRIFKENSFDFIYSNIVFQHLPPRLTLSYIQEFLRIIKRNGVIIFQITTGIIGFKNKVRRFLNFVTPAPFRNLYKKLRFKTWGIKDMFWIKEEVLNNFIISNGGKVIDCVDDFSSMPRFKGKRYCITR